VTKVRRLVWIDSNLLIMMSDKGIDLSTFLGKSAVAFLDLPEDPTEKLLRENIEKASIRLRIQYMNELRSRIQEKEQTHLVENLEKAKQKELILELQTVGEMLRRTSCYPKILEALKTMDVDAPCWDTALREINSANGDTYEFPDLWNKAIEWHRLCPVGNGQVK